MNDHIQYDFLYDNHFAELKEAELLTERLNLLQTVEPYIGRFYSQDYVRRHVLQQTDTEILEQDELIEKEIEDGIIPDPNAMVDPMGMEGGAPVPGGAPAPEPTDPIKAPTTPKDPDLSGQGVI
jgi:hypothetical protein